MNILYFAWVREKIGVGEETANPPPGVQTAAQLMDWLAAQSPKHADAFSNRAHIRVAIDQTHCPHTSSILGAKEVAFFPPVTGGAGFDLRVQMEAFDIAAEVATFTERNKASGAICTFTGLMRDFRGADRTSGEKIAAMELDAYPAMAEKQLAELAAEAGRRWPVDDIAVIHRYGKLAPSEAIVFVATASSHRAEAFASCEFLMDWLKTKAPFWKKETGPSGQTWVSETAEDLKRAERWAR